MTTETWQSAYYRLEQTFAGVASPEEMGTTGLIGWVIAGPGGWKRGWNRTRKALCVVRSRRGSVEGFSRAVLAATPNHAHRERLAGYFKTLLA